MAINLNALMQYLVPQHAVSYLAGRIAEVRIPWLKNALIQLFIKHFGVDMSQAVYEDINHYPTFNSFFTRHLKPELRPIVQGPDEIACPADGVISQLGQINENKLLQAKGHHFSLENLLGSPDEAQLFMHGNFMTFYLAPKDYHRVHMPMTGTLRKSVYIPGSLFSVNQSTAENITALFTRNERLVCLFDTDIGPMAIVLVAAMLVGSINTVWDASSEKITLNRGAEMGHFKMGSTVILLFSKDRVCWSNATQEGSLVQMGQLIGHSTR